MGEKDPGKRDGTGPAKDSHRRTVERNPVGRRGAVCKEPPKRKP